MKKAALSDVKDDLSKYLRLAEKESIIITRHGKPVARLVPNRDRIDRSQARATIQRIRDRALRLHPVKFDWEAVKSQRDQGRR